MAALTRSYQYRVEMIHGAGRIKDNGNGSRDFKREYGEPP